MAFVLGDAINFIVRKHYLCHHNIIECTNEKNTNSYLQYMYLCDVCSVIYFSRMH